MKTSIREHQIIAGSATLLFFATLFAAGYFMRTNMSLRGDFDQERLRSENLLSEKLAITKEAEKLRTDISSWKGKNAEMNQKLENAMGRVNRMEGTIRSLRTENATITEVRNELAELQQIRRDLEAVVAMMENEKRVSEQRIMDLTAEVASLQSELAVANIQLIPFNITDNFKAETRRGRNMMRPTVIASRARQLSVSFDVPESMANYLSFEITRPDGSYVTQKNADIALVIIDDGRNLIADVSPLTGEYELGRRVEMTYFPERRLEPGIYTIEILYNGPPAGMSQLRLR